MKAILLILALAMPAGAQQVFPSDIKDPDVLRNMEFLLEQYNILRSSLTNNSVTAAAALVDVSSFTYLPGGVVTGGSLGPCLANSTVTLTTGNYPLEIIFSGSVSNNSTQESALSFLVNGAFISPLTGTIAVITPSPLSTQCQNASFKYQIPAQGAGSHSICLTAATNSGVNLTITGRSTPCPYQSTWNTASQFGFREVH